MNKTARVKTRGALRDGDEKLRAVVQALPDLLFVLDEDGKYIEALSSSKSLLYARVNELVGRRMHDVLPKESADLFLRTVRRTLKSGRSQILEYSLDVPAGRRFFEGRTSPLRATRGDRRRIVWISRDITERKNLEQRLRAQVAKTSRAYKALQRAQAQLVRSEKFASIGMLISGVAHELNNPLNVMYGNLKLMGDATGISAASPGAPGAGFPRMRRMLQDALRAAERAKSVMEEFRNFARDIRAAEFADLNQCLKEALSVARHDLPAGIRVVEKLGSIPKVRCLSHQIRQVFLNLIENAIESLSGSGTVTVRTRLQRGRVIAEVVDTGRGIPPEVRRKLFEPFWTTKPLGKGLGLGLSISAMIVDHHHGRLAFTSRVGKGSVFKVMLPVDAGSPPARAGT